MRHLWIGVLILILLLALGLVISLRMGVIHTPIAEDLAAAAEAALSDDWDTAMTCVRSASARWEKYRRFTAAFADHNPMDELDGLFAELEVYAKEREMPHFASTCTRLNHLANAMAESHMLYWWNLL